MKIILISLAALVASVSAIGAPSYATCIDFENQTNGAVTAEVHYESGEKAAATVEAGATYKFSSKEINQGSFTTVDPVLSLRVTYDIAHIGPLSVTHPIEVVGIQECVTRVAKNNLGGVYIS